MPSSAILPEKLVRCIDRFTEHTGHFIAWLTLLMMLVNCVVVVLRYLLGSGSIALQESVSYIHASVFMLGAAYTLQRGGHVRVDIFYIRCSAKTQALIDIFGGLFMLIPVCVLILWMSWDYVASSWAIREASRETSGLPWVYVLKTLILIMPITLLLQSVAEILKNILFYFGLGGSHTGESPETRV